ncbi:glycosyltransferase family 15 protein [Roridomyces roridus]|uniref:Glycosyltransferase family 15 protein n=1 Tax=Roridomyces roridus TaxID=1738132 RepID=A0AAD7FZF6_9AGAR|nr:glycosyltransferase family 15 protein [Roridomyces roridus]
MRSGHSARASSTPSSTASSMTIPRRYAFLAFTAAFLVIIFLAHQNGYTLPPHGPSRFGISASVSGAAGYTAAIVYLLSVLPGPRLPHQIFDSMSLMQKHIPWRHQWPILLLHAGAYDDSDSRELFVEMLRDKAAEHGLSSEVIDGMVRRLEFVRTDHELPEGIPATGANDDPIWAQEWPGYHMMCSFYSHKIFSHPRIKDLTYYLRLDDDSSVLSPTCIDPFEYMHVHNKSYAYQHVSPDMGWVTDGLWPFISNYAKRHPSVEAQLARNDWEWPEGRTWPGVESEYAWSENFPSYETNFDLVKVPRWRTPEMQEFLKELASEPRRFYFSRWGDAPIRMAQVAMFLDIEKEVHQMCEISYAHKAFIFEECPCVPL